MYSRPDLDPVCPNHLRCLPGAAALSAGTARPSSWCLLLRLSKLLLADTRSFLGTGALCFYFIFWNVSIFAWPRGDQQQNNKTPAASDQAAGTMSQAGSSQEAQSTLCTPSKPLMEIEISDDTSPLAVDVDQVHTRGRTHSTVSVYLHCLLVVGVRLQP